MPNKTLSYIILSLILGLTLGFWLDDPEVVTEERVIVATYEHSQKCKEAGGKLVYQYNYGFEDYYRCYVAAKEINLSPTYAK